MDPKKVYLDFLKSQNITPAQGFNSCKSVEELVDLNYDAMTEPCLRALAATAMREFNSNTADKVSWGLILDCVRDTTSKRRAAAEKNLMGLLSYCSNLPPASDAGSNPSKISSDKALVIKKCRECYDAGQCDKTFMELLMNTRDACRQHAGSEAAAAADENVVMVEFFIRCFTALFLKDSKGNASAQLPAPPVAAKAAVAAGGTSAPSATSSSSESTSVVELERRLDQVEILDERQLMSAGTYMTQLIRHCNGNVSALKAAIILLYRHGDSETGHGKRPAESASGVPLPSRYELNRAAFRRMLSDNLQACVTAGYVNKRRLFELIISTVENLEEEEQRAASGNVGDGAAGSAAAAAASGTESLPASSAGGASGTSASTYHAPQFLENKTRGRLNLVVEAPRSFIDGTRTSNIIMTLSKGKGSSSVIAGAGHSNKHKADKRLGREITGQLADSVASHMKERGYAVCDHFLPAELVRRIRTECGLFQDYYEASEIWVGKQADVGAHLTVPSVRGDRVLWMCGAHPQDAAPEGITRRVATLGEVEPCRLNIKAIAPVRKFVALKEFIQRVDAFVHELKGRVTRLSGIYERSDVMFSIYPGKGARFANHIDNTTRDGRVLTVVAYLNPSWEVDSGGAIRVQVPPQYQKQASSDSSSSSGGAAGENVTAKHCVDVFPECGRIVMFYSDEIPHEVCPTYAERHACSIWYYDSTERKEAVQRAAESGKAAEAQIAGIEVQTEARTFIAELMGRDRKPLTPAAADESAASVAVEAEGIDEIITAALLAELNDKVQNSLSAEALKIVANITGAPSPESFKEGFKLLVPEDLRNIRQLFRRMGLTEAGTM